ncbi:MAG: TlpA family protein disulfide reductase [Nitrospinae bacterium]|nr:TlpA family protein disulfide reductase [Nitrospinota bacterium]
MTSFRGLFPSPRRGVLYLLLLAFGYALGMGIFYEPPNTVEAAENEPAPKLILHKLGGKKTSLEDYRGKWVFLNFWATWCPPCLKEMPEMEEFYKKFKSKNLVMLAVSVDKDDPSKIASFIKDHGYTFEVFLDPDGESLDKFHTSKIPATFIINPKGEVVSQAAGPREWMDPEIIKYFNDLMKKG